MTETVELRNKPKLKIILNKSEFEIVDASEPKNNGIYSYGEIKRAELNAERTDWFFSALSNIADFLMGSAIGGSLKNKANLKLQLADRTLKIWLIDADYKKAEKTAELINNKKTYTQHR